MIGLGRVFTVLVTLSALASCNEADFAGQRKEALAASATNDVTTPSDADITIKQIKGAEGIADIIFLVDTSSSMESEQDRLEENLKYFMERFEKENGTIDFQVIMIGQNFNFPDVFSKPFEIVEQEVTSYDTLNILKKFLDNPDLKSLSLRPNAVKEIVVISDDNANIRSKDFEKYLLDNIDKIGPVRINGFIGLNNSKQNDWCEIASPGSTYKDLAESVNIGGLIQDLCSEDWSDLLDALAKRIIRTNVYTEFQLKNPLSEGNRVEVFINGKKIDDRHITVDYMRSVVLLDGGVSPAVGDKLTVKRY